ncbi:MAG TPA: anaerobic sulfatase maturase [Candidatus Sumerlaeota bacterium]|nr:anaerobic sulfatase maturase [Candidatus Sumerlaeota bacterium]HPS01161.1 anaerobic sulfatase maturase [Candidatus Sumerlaeota bacterium]
MTRSHRPVQVLIKPASADCNLACEYCFYCEKRALYPNTSTPRMAPDVQEEMIKQILRYGGDSPVFAYQGGEPTLMGLDYFKRSVALQMRHGQGQNVANSIQTNGLLLDEAWCEFLTSYRFLVGLSLDGPADLHDQYRRDRGGHPSHARVEQATRLMREFETEFNILTVVTAHSLPRARELYAYFRELGCQWLQFIPAVEFDPATGRLADFSPDPIAYGHFLCDLFDAWRQDFRNGRPTTSVRLFDTLLGLYCGGSSPANCSFRQQCGHYVVIEHNGDVYACDFFVEPRWKLGNLMRHSLRTLAESALQREFGRQKTRLPESCGGCEWLFLCHGGCPKDRQRSGAPGQMGVDYFCEAHKMFFAYSKPVFEDLKRQVRAEQLARLGFSAGQGVVSP